MHGDELSATFAALADARRRDILAHLMSGEATVTELAEPLKISLPTICRHLNVLERAGLITRGRDAQWRPCRIQGDPLKHAVEWIEHYRMAWERKLEGLHGYIHELRAKEHSERKGRQKGKPGK